MEDTHTYREQGDLKPLLFLQSEVNNFNLITLLQAVSFAVKLLIRILVVLGSNLDRDTGYTEFGIFWFSSIPPGKC
jgi:hypothetical protein